MFEVMVVNPMAFLGESAKRICSLLLHSDYFYLQQTGECLAVALISLGKSLISLCPSRGDKVARY